ncbi:diadenylate cyclase [Blattabacterium cuenoti]|uniref:diadenylate cyclase n=1 Tax=Blattabacterium cuenoti TaxID=1653831 RepID=UPI001EEAAF4E|nr:diadenylate cyclase [Blattabacterium cuenoti]
MFHKFLHILKTYFIDIIDISLVTIILLKIYRLVYNTAALNIFYGIIATFIFWKIVETYNMRFLSIVISTFFKGGFLALIILFQPEIRKFLLIVGSRLFINKFILSFFKKPIISIKKETIESVTNACAIFSRDKTGILIVIKLQQDLNNFIKNGDDMNVKVNTPILESIFYKNSPLHDGATIIADNKIIKTRAILPVSYNKDIPYRLGLRHRAAFGITEKTDAICLVISEETGYISYIKNGNRIIITNINNLRTILEKDIT